MKASVIRIGNSKGVRIPKKLLEEAGLKDAVELRASANKLIITPARNDVPKLNDEYLLSLSALSDWNDPAEDEAWAYLQ